jgi:hypothetical protein
MDRSSLPKKDWVILGMQCFFFLSAVTLELYWVVYHDELVARSQTDVIASLFRIYGDGDSAYYEQVTPFTLGLETIQIFCTQPLNLWLIYAICKRKPYRHALQLMMASYVSYSVLLYFWNAHLSGYAGMCFPHSLYAFFIFYVPNFPWLFGHLYMAYDSFRAITQRFQRSAGATGLQLAGISSPATTEP